MIVKIKNIKLSGCSSVEPEINMNIIANSIEDCLEILNKDSESSFDFENPSDPQNSHIIEYPADGSDSIYWSWEQKGNTFYFYC